MLDNSVLDRTVFNLRNTMSIEVYVYGLGVDEEDRHIADYPLHPLSPAMRLYLPKPMKRIRNRHLPLMRLPRWARAMDYFNNRINEVKAWAVCDALHLLPEKDRTATIERMESLARLGATYPVILGQLDGTPPIIERGHMDLRKREMLYRLHIQLRKLGCYDKKGTAWAK